MRSSDMKRNRKLLLTVTATSMAAVVGCAGAQPVGTVAQPPHEHDQTTDAAVSPDVEQAQQPGAGSDEHTVGTVAHPPDKK